jgi:hypothetical protein
MAYQELEISLKENRPNPADPFTTALDRFLRGELTESQITDSLSKDTLVPQDLTHPYLYLEIYTNFISSLSKKEINIPLKVKKNIIEIFETKGTQLPKNVFDQAAAEILSLLYTDVFRRFTAFKEKSSHDLSKLSTQELAKQKANMDTQPRPISPAKQSVLDLSQLSKGIGQKEQILYSKMFFARMVLHKGPIFDDFEKFTKVHPKNLII